MNSPVSAGDGKEAEYVLPDAIEAKLDPWIKIGVRSKSWATRARCARCSSARASAGVRITADPSVDIGRLEIRISTQLSNFRIS